MAESEQIANVSSESSSITSVPSITLKENDLKTIAEILHSSFETNITQMINNIISGVVDGLKATISSLEKENRLLRTRVASLEAKVDEAEQYSRRNFLRVAGVPEHSSENTDDYIVDMAKAIGADISVNDIERSHRVGRPRTPGRRPRDIIVKFVSYRVRRRVYSAGTLTKAKGFMGVYINEDLTKSRNELIRKARKMVKLKYIKSVWSSDGTILVRNGDEDVRRITSEDDLAQFGPVPSLDYQFSTTRARASSGGSDGSDPTSAGTGMVHWSLFCSALRLYRHENMSM